MSRSTSQRRSACGHVALENRKSQAVFECQACNAGPSNADVNSARNIAAGRAVTARGDLGASRSANREPQLCSPAVKVVDGVGIPWLQPGEDVKIVRTWSARATKAGADAYSAYFEQTLLPQLRKLDGFSGAFLLARDDDGLVELTAHTIWESLDAIRTFAGDDITTAVVEPEALAVLQHSDPTVVHRDVLVHA